MKNIALCLRYDGSRYHGWQVQKNDVTIAETVENAIFRVCGERLRVVGCGRTDAGVHALGQKAHFDYDGDFPLEKIPLASQSLLPEDIAILRAEEVSSDLHAQYSAKKKTYRYQTYLSRENHPLLNDTYAPIPYAESYFDFSKVEKAAKDLIGTHDFAGFANKGSQVRSTIRTIYDVKVEKEGMFITFDITGNGFLYNMVRIIAGTLRDIGSGKLAPGALATAIETGNRLDLGVTAPAHGLTLMEVFYALPDTYGIHVPPKEVLP